MRLNVACLSRSASAASFERAARGHKFPCHHRLIPSAHFDERSFRRRCALSSATSVTGIGCALPQGGDGQEAAPSASPAEHFETDHVATAGCRDVRDGDSVDADGGGGSSGGSSSGGGSSGGSSDRGVLDYIGSDSSGGSSGGVISCSGSNSSGGGSSDSGVLDCTIAVAADIYATAPGMADGASVVTSTDHVMSDSMPALCDRHAAIVDGVNATRVPSPGHHTVRASITSPADQNPDRMANGSNTVARGTNSASQHGVRSCTDVPRAVDVVAVVAIPTPDPCELAPHVPPACQPPEGAQPQQACVSPLEHSEQSSPQLPLLQPLLPVAPPPPSEDALQRPPGPPLLPPTERLTTPQHRLSQLSPCQLHPKLLSTPPAEPFEEVQQQPQLLPVAEPPEQPQPQLPLPPPRPPEQAPQPPPLMQPPLLQLAESPATSATPATHYPQLPPPRPLEQAPQQPPLLHHAEPPEKPGQHPPWQPPKSPAKAKQQLPLLPLSEPSKTPQQQPLPLPLPPESYEQAAHQPPLLQLAEPPATPATHHSQLRQVPPPEPPEETQQQQPLLPSFESPGHSQQHTESDAAQPPDPKLAGQHHLQEQPLKPQPPQLLLPEARPQLSGSRKREGTAPKAESAKVHPFDFLASVIWQLSAVAVRAFTSIIASTHEAQSALLTSPDPALKPAPQAPVEVRFAHALRQQGLSRVDAEGRRSGDWVYNTTVMDLLGFLCRGSSAIPACSTASAGPGGGTPATAGPITTTGLAGTPASAGTTSTTDVVDSTATHGPSPAASLAGPTVTPHKGEGYDLRVCFRNSDYRATDFAGRVDVPDKECTKLGDRNMVLLVTETRRSGPLLWLTSTATSDYEGCHYSLIIVNARLRLVHVFDTARRWSDREARMVVMGQFPKVVWSHFDLYNHTARIRQSAATCGAWCVWLAYAYAFNFHDCRAMEEEEGRRGTLLYDRMQEDAVGFFRALTV